MCEMELARDSLNFMLFQSLSVQDNPAECGFWRGKGVWRVSIRHLLDVWMAQSDLEHFYGVVLGEKSPVTVVQFMCSLFSPYPL